MERYHFFAFLLCGVFMSGSVSLPYRNFSIDCETMMTDHEAEPQESPSPYHISLQSERYDPGNNVKVNIEGPSDGAGFKWFMLQARDIDENIPAGSFLITDENTQTFNCYNLSNSALIHMDSNEKHNVTSLWVSPDARRIQFIASVFQDPETYWVVIANVVLFPRDNNETESNSTMVEEESKQANVSSSRSRKKSSGITVKINCGQGGTGSYASSSECAKTSTFSSPSGSSQAQGGVVYQGGVKKNGCIGGATASVYNKYGCTDPGVDYGGSSSYGQSVSTVSNKGKVIVYAPSNPFPPERTSYTSQLANSKYKHIQSTKYTEKIQGSRPESDVRITIQSGQPLQICDKTSSSYNSQACKLSIQSSTSQSSSSYGSQQSGTKVTFGSSGSSPSAGGSGTKIIFGGSGSPTSVGSSGTSTSGRGNGITITVDSSGSSTPVGGSGSSTTFGGTGSSTSSSSSACRQGFTYDGNPCKPGGASSQQNYGSSQGGQGGSYGGSSQYGQGGQRGPYGGNNQYGQSGSYGGGGSSQYGQGGSYGGSSHYGQGGSYGGNSQYGQGGSHGGNSQYGQGGSYGGSSQYGQSGPSGSYGGGRPYVQSGQSGSYGGGSQYGQGGSYGSSSNYGQGSQTSGSYSSNRCDEGDASTYGSKALSSSNCRGKRDVAVQGAFNAFIEKIRELKASPLALIRRIRSEKARTPIRVARNEKNETSNSDTTDTYGKLTS